MINLRLDFQLKLGLLFLLALPSMVFSQITITAQDFLNQIGSRQVVLEEMNSSTTIDVGSPGANQVWDFSNMVISDTVVAVFEYLSPDQTVSGSTFPEANFVQTGSIDPGFKTPEAIGGAVFQFYNVTNSEFINLGDSTFFSFMGTDTSFVFFQNDTLAPLPIAFGNTWMTFERDTTGLFPIVATISIDTTMNTIDGWGTVRLPLGEFECLRLKQEVKAINQDILGGIVTESTETYIQYDWINKSSFLLASAQSQNGETNPNFTNAQGFGVLDTITTSPPTSVDDPNGIPSGFELSQNYPNPFNPETVITYQLSQNGRVELAVYNLLGQKVRVLLNEIKSVGTYEARWEGTNDHGEVVSSGVYIYRLQFGEFERTKKMIFLR